MKYILFFCSLLFLTSCGSTETPGTLEYTNTGNTILALGDSLTAGYGLPIVDSYPSQLEIQLKEKGYNYRVNNAGISGDTTAELLSRLDWVLDGEAPSLIILCIGANDAFQSKSVADIESNLRQIIEKIQTKKIPILFAGMKAPLNLGREYGRSYESIFPKLAKEYNLVYMPFLLEGVAMQSRLNQEDRIHPTASGYTIVVENLMKILKQQLITQ